MPNFTALLKTEISRLARKEIRAEIEPFKKIISQQKSELGKLKRRVEILEKGLRNSKSTLNSSQHPSAPFQPEKPPSLRFRTDGFASLRKKLDLSGAEMAKLLGVSIQSVYHWESGKAKPRAAQLVAIAAVRKLGKKEIASRIQK
jgi:DNA-binding transcriptional regulator YiaG